MIRWKGEPRRKGARFVTDPPYGWKLWDGDKLVIHVEPLGPIWGPRGSHPSWIWCWAGCGRDTRDDDQTWMTDREAKDDAAKWYRKFKKQGNP